MGLLIRTLLIWLLVLAVPAQGAAALTMAFCAPNHHGGAAASHAAPMASTERAHAPGAHEGHAQAAAAPDNSADAGGSAAPAKSGHAGKHKCSACASCCSIGAMLNSALAVPVPDLTPTVFSVMLPRVAGFALDGPDRPPRIVLAQLAL